MEFEAHEARRAANRLHDNWKKNPWLPGSTIDLGEHEWAFQEESGLARRHAPTAPAIVDWLRWKYRRLQLDRKCDAKWLRVLRDELPKRLLSAGPAPTSGVVQQEQGRASAPVKWRVAAAEPFSKRSGLDRPSAQAAPKPRALRGRGRPKRRVEPSPDDRQEIALFVHQHREVLAPMFERCQADEQSAIIDALRAFVVDPNDHAARDRWMRIVLALREL